MTNGIQRWKGVTSSLIATMLPAVAGVSLVIGAPQRRRPIPAGRSRSYCSVPSGSAIDVTARLVTRDLSERLGKPVIVENRPGGGSTIGVKEFARAAPDGHIASGHR